MPDIINHHFNITVHYHRLAFYQNEQKGPSTFSLWSASLKTKGLSHCGGTSWVLTIRLPGYQLSLCLNCSYMTTFLACQGSISNTSFSPFFFQIHLLTQCDLHQPYCKVWVQSSDIFIILILNWMHSRVWYTGPQAWWPAFQIAILCLWPWSWALHTYFEQHIIWRLENRGGRPSHCPISALLMFIPLFHYTNAHNV